MNEKFDLSSIKLALEHATFKDYKIRDGINTVLKAVELDLEEIGFEPSDNTKETVEVLDGLINDIEAVDKPHVRLTEKERVDLEGEELEDVIEIDPNNNDDDEDDHVINVDEELDEEGY